MGEGGGVGSGGGVLVGATVGDCATVGEDATVGVTVGVVAGGADVGDGHGRVVGASAVAFAQALSMDIPTIMPMKIVTNLTSVPSYSF